MLSGQQRQEVDERIEIFFSHYLLETFPEQVTRILEGHNNDCRAHGEVAKKVDRLRFILIGLAVGSGFLGGSALGKLFSLF